MGITVLKNNVPWGPFSRAQIEDGLARGDFTLKYLAHAQGLKEWLPLGEVLHFVDLGGMRPSPPTANDLPPVPGAGTNPVATIPAPPIRPPALPLGISVPMRLPPPVKKPEVPLKKASFIARCIAFLVDCSVLFVPIIILFAIGSLTVELQDWWQQTEAESMRQERALLWRNFTQLFLLVAVGLGWLYGAGLECSRWQATVGKRWMGLKVTDTQGERLSFLRATGRHAAKYLSALPFLFGFVMALFSARGLSLHDRLAGTRVVRR